MLACLLTNLASSTTTTKTSHYLTLLPVFLSLLPFHQDGYTSEDSSGGEEGSFVITDEVIGEETEGLDQCEQCFGGDAQGSSSKHNKSTTGGPRRGREEALIKKKKQRNVEVHERQALAEFQENNNTMATNRKKRTTTTSSRSAGEYLCAYVMCFSLQTGELILCFCAHRCQKGAASAPKKGFGGGAAATCQQEEEG